MPSKSKNQQQLFGLALSIKRGETPRSEASEEVLKIVDNMSEKEIKDFAETKHKGLPTKKESIMLSKLFHEVREVVREEMKDVKLNERGTRFEDFWGSKVGKKLKKYGITSNKFNRSKFQEFIEDEYMERSARNFDALLNHLAKSVDLQPRKYSNKPVGDLEDDIADEFEKRINESNITEAGSYKSDDLNFLIDQLTNSMEHYDKKGFVSHLSKETKYDKKALASIFEKYWDLNAHQRLQFSTKDWNKWLMHNRFNLGESKSVNEADEVAWAELDKKEQKVIETLSKVLDVGKYPEVVFQGIHGTVVKFSNEKAVGEYRLSIKEIKALSRLPIRWIDSDEKFVNVGL